MKDAVPAPEIALDAQGLASTVAAVSCLVVLLGIFREWYVAAYGTATALEDLRQISLDTEHSLGSWWSSLVMAACAAMMFLQAAGERELEARIALRWMVLACLFLGMSVDESVSFHELLIDPLRNRFDLGGLLFFSWIVPAFFFCIGAALYFLPFLRALPRAYALGLIVAGGLYVIGALALEAVGGYFADRRGLESTAYIATATLEESLEIVALTILAVVLLKMLSASPRGLSLRFARKRGATRRLINSRI